jgi:hypothetical protein
MWEPRRLTTLWPFTACYRDSFTFYIFILKGKYSKTALTVKNYFTSLYKMNAQWRGHVYDYCLESTRYSYKKFREILLFTHTEPIYRKPTHTSKLLIYQNLIIGQQIVQGITLVYGTHYIFLISIRNIGCGHCVTT